MTNSVLKLSDGLRSYSSSGIFFNIIQIGTGGTGGYLVQRLSKLLYALKKKDNLFRFSYKLVDGDRVESSNLLRQPFIEEDLQLPKAQVLAERYEGAYGIPILYKNEYIETSKDITNMIYGESSYFHHHIPVILGCVDNNATRQILHEVFQELPNIVYIDSGIESMDEEGSKDSGYSGQVVCGMKLREKLFLSPVGEVYSDILEDKDSRLPTQACGQNVVYQPQRMQTNEMAALIMNGYLNTLLSDHEIVSHYTNFNARTMLVRPTHCKEGVRS